MIQRFQLQNTLRGFSRLIDEVAPATTGINSVLTGNQIIDLRELKEEIDKRLKFGIPANQADIIGNAMFQVRKILK